MKIFDVGRPNKKGGLNVSINAIVILIMAITMLGLGLGFIRNMFSSASGKLGSAIDSTSLKNPADANHPLTMDDTIRIKVDAEEQVEIGFYNTQSQEVNDVRLQVGDCQTSAGESVEDQGMKNPNLAAPRANKVGPSSDTGYKAIMSLKDTDLKGGQTYICTLEALGTIGGGSEESLETFQFYLDVTS